MSKSKKPKQQATPPPPEVTDVSGDKEQSLLREREGTSAAFATKQKRSFLSRLGNKENNL